MTTATIRKIKSASVACPFCNGTGHLPHYRHIQNGDCFACGATGKLRDLNAFIGDNSDIMLTVYLHNGQFSGADFRQRTWKFADSSLGRYKEWGRDRFYRRVDDASDAREIWRNAKQLGIITELVD